MFRFFPNKFCCKGLPPETPKTRLQVLKRPGKISNRRSIIRICPILSHFDSKFGVKMTRNQGCNPRLIIFPGLDGFCNLVFRVFQTIKYLMKKKFELNSLILKLISTIFISCPTPGTISSLRSHIPAHGPVSGIAPSISHL